MQGNIVDDIYEEILKKNSEVNSKSIPDSDEFINYISAFHGVQSTLVKQVLKVLAASHMIFSIEIVVEDLQRNIPRIEGYVVSELNIVRKLKAFFQNEMVYMYNSQYGKNMMVHQILKEIFPKIKSLNNTPLGQLINKAMMLEEFEKLIERDFKEYNEEWKKNRLEVELSKANISMLMKNEDPEKAKEEKSKTEEEPQRSFKLPRDGKLKRAVDSPKYTEYLSKSTSYPLDRLINIYGIKFFIQVNLRKYEFNYLKKLIEDKQIARRSELLVLRDMLRTVKKNINEDEELKKHLDDIYGLERIISHYIYFSDIVEI